MDELFLFPAAVRRDPAVEAWFKSHTGALGTIARCWFEALRNCGEEVREILHDGHPTACVGEAAFAYVDAFKAHVNLGFFRGADLADQDNLLLGTGKLMRHVKLSPDDTDAADIDAAALQRLIEDAYADMRRRAGTD